MNPLYNKLIALDSELRSQANALYRSYLQEENLKKGTTILKTRGATMDRLHNLQVQIGICIFGKEYYESIVNPRKVLQRTQVSATKKAPWYLDFTIPTDNYSFTY